MAQAAFVPALLAQQSGGTSTVIPFLFMLAMLGLVVLVIAGMWKVYAKADQPGWACIVPFVNMYVLCKIVGRPGWWLFLLLLPFLSIFFWVIVSYDLAKSFGKGPGMALALFLVPFVAYPVLGFGDAEYQGPSVA